MMMVGMKRRLFAFLLLFTTIRNNWSTFAFVTTTHSIHRNNNAFTTTTTTTKNVIPSLIVSTTPPSQNHLSALPSFYENIVFSADSIANQLASNSLQQTTTPIVALPIMYIAGLFTSLSPCVWGLLPITMSYISSAAALDNNFTGEEKPSIIGPTIAFALGLATVFCTFGLLAASLGQVFGTVSSNNIILSILSAVICLTMGFQLLDFIKLPLPNVDLDLDEMFVNEENENQQGDANAIMKLDEKGDIVVIKRNNNNNWTKSATSLFRTFLLGGSSALVASPCSTPVLTSILAYVGGSNNIIWGAALLFGYTLGYSTPLLLVAATGGQLLLQLQQQQDDDDEDEVRWWSTASLGKWVTPLTGGVLLWYGTNTVLTSIWGDPTLQLAQQQQLS